MLTKRVVKSFFDGKIFPEGEAEAEEAPQVKRRRHVKSPVCLHFTNGGIAKLYIGHPTVYDSGLYDRFVDGAAAARHRYEHFTNGCIVKLYTGHPTLFDSGIYDCQLQNDYGIAETEGQIEVVVGCQYLAFCLIRPNANKTCCKKFL